MSYDFNDHADEAMRKREEGQYVLHADYAALEAENNALKARIRSINVWSECDKCECLFIPGGKGGETTCGTCLKEERDALLARHNALREAVAWERECDECYGWIQHEIEAELRFLYDTWEISFLLDCARAEVGRLLAATDTKSEVKEE